MLITDIKIDQNVSHADTRINYFNEAKKDTVLNLVIRTFTTFNALHVYVTVKLSPISKTPDYQIVLLKTVIDVKKFLKGAFANPILKSAAEKTFFKLSILNPSSRSFQ